MAELRIVMMGTGTFAEPTLERLLAGTAPVVGVFTQPDRDGVVKRGSTRQTGKGIKEIAQERGVPVFQPANVNHAEGLEMLRSVLPDVLVVAAYGQILSNDLLAIPTRGAINVHASLLPKYRGAAPVAWAILQGEAQTGVTIIRISAGLDAGEMLAQEKIDIYPDETAGELEGRLGPLGARLAMQTLERMRLGPVTGLKQERGLVTKAPKLKKEDGLIDWNRPAEFIARQVRAMQPWPTAYTFLHQSSRPATRIVIGRTGKIIGALTGSAPPTPGLLWSGDGDILWAFTSASEALQILELQPAGKKRMSASDFLRGHPLKAGDRFGPELFPPSL